MSSDQLTYVLVALIVTGVAILLLLAGALMARRGRVSARPAGTSTALPEPAPAAAFPITPPQPQASAVPPLAAAVPPLAAAVPPLAAATPPVADASFIQPRPATLPPVPWPGAPEPDLEPEVEPDLGPEPEAELEPPPQPPAAEEVFVTAADRQAAASRVHDPREEEIIEGFLSIAPRRRETAAFENRPPSASAPAPVPAAVAPTVAPAAPVESPAPAAAGADPYLDEATGLESRLSWERVLAEENARYVRYRRPVGLVVAELDGLPKFEAQFGADAGRRILAAVGGAMRRTARRTDRVAHVGGGRFLVLLPETDEIQAINYVERVRGECERWLEAGAVALHVSMGWASPSAVGELDTALRTAEERMYAERRRAARAGTISPDASR